MKRAIQIVCASVIVAGLGSTITPANAAGIDVVVPADTTVVQLLQAGELFGNIEIGEAGLLIIDGDLTDISTNNLTLGAGSQIRASLASTTTNLSQEVTLTVSGKLTAAGGVSEVGSWHIDDVLTNLTLADGSVFDWVFGPGEDTFIDISGMLTLGDGAAGITINIIDGLAVADRDDVPLFFTAYDEFDPALIPMNLTINKPAGWTFDTLEQIDDGVYLTNLTTPEPTTIIVMLAAGLPALLKRRRRRS
jgi:hypothetical protein